MLVLLYGFSLHVALLWLGRVLWDGATYAYLGGSFATLNAFVPDWDPAGSFSVWEFGVMYPLVLTAFYKLAGFTVAITKVAGLVVSLLAVVVGYLTTKDLFDRPRALAVAALLAVDPTLLRTNYFSYAEPLVVALFVAAFWALLKSVRDSRYMIAFGVFTGMFYLSKTIIGWSFLVLAALALFAWRWYQVRGGILRDPYWPAGLAILLGFVAVREVMVESSGRVVLTHGLSYGFGQPETFLPMLALKFPFLVVLVGVFAVFWLPELKRAVRHLKELDHSILILGASGVAIGTWIFIAVIGITEPHNPVFWQDNMRYTVVLMVPTLWLAFRHTTLPDEGSGLRWWPHLRRTRIAEFLILGAITSIVLFAIGLWLAVFMAFGAVAALYPSPRKRLALMLAAFLLTGTNAITLVDQPAFIEAAAALNERLRPGDVVALDRRVLPTLNSIQLYSYVSVRDIEVVVYQGGANSTFIMSQVASGVVVTYSGYTEIGTFVSASERTWLSRAIGGDEPIAKHEVHLWQLNTTLNRQPVVR